MVKSNRHKQTSLQTRSGFAWLELLLALAMIALLVQLFPATLDVRNWSRTTWFVANVVILLVLVAVRFGPQVVEDWRERRQRLSSEHSKQEKQREMKEQREALERVKQAQKRRMY